MKIVIPIIISLILVGCSGNINNIDKSAKGHFGVLSNATVNIYELGGAKKLLFSEKTTMGDTVDEIGNFDTHRNTFHTTKFYQYELSGGENWDIDKNGIKDENSTPNSQVFRAIYKGSKSHVAWWGVQTESEQKTSEEL